MLLAAHDESSRVRSVAAPVAAGGMLLGACVVAALVDPSGGPTICPFKLATGLDCPGCGATRAMHKLFSGHPVAAMDLNLLAVIALPFILWGLFVAFTRVLGGPRWRGFSLSPRWTAVVVVVMLAFSVVRNVPGTPLSWLGTGA